jgi:hypothetical protein
MTFDGQLVAFHGEATSVLGDRRMSCATMQVTLTEPIRFDQPSADGKKVELASVYCRNDVKLQHRVYADSKLTEVLTAEVWELRIDRESGEMHAQGPGWMNMWRREAGARGGLGVQQTAKPNRPMQIDTAEWQFTRVKFDGQMRGNLHRRYARFLERVEIVHGPVKLPNHTLHRDGLPKGAGYMKCHELQVNQTPADNRDRHFIQLAGVGNAELEGHGFFASADQITYDEAKESYVLRGFGKNRARIWHRNAPGEDSPPTELQRMVYFPATRTILADGIAGGEGAP